MRETASRRRTNRRIRRLSATGGGQAVTEATLRRYGPEVLQYLRFVLGGHDEAANEAFSAFAKAVRLGIRDIDLASPRLWAYRAAWKVAKSFRTAEVRPEAPSRVLPWVAAALEAGDNVHIMQIPPGGGVLEGLRAFLDREEHALLVLRVSRRFTWAQVAYVLSIGSTPVDAVVLQKRFALLKEKLARVLREQELVPWYL